MHPRVPDILSSIRLLGSVTLLFVGALTPLFLIVLTSLYLTDVLDGYTARRYGLCTPHGQVLDSLADFSLTSCMIISLVNSLEFENWMVASILLVILFRAFSVVVGSIRFRSLALIHTNLNKFAGLFISMSPYMLLFLDMGFVVSFLCTLSFMAAFEELLINSTSSRLERDRGSLF